MQNKHGIQGWEHPKSLWGPKHQHFAKGRAGPSGTSYESITTLEGNFTLSFCPAAQEGRVAEPVPHTSQVVASQPVSDVGGGDSGQATTLPLATTPSLAYTLQAEPPADWKTIPVGWGQTDLGTGTYPASQESLGRETVGQKQLEFHIIFISHKTEFLFSFFFFQPF